MMSSSYTCPSPEGTTPSTLSITYKYEVITRPNTKLDDTALSSIQKAMLKSVARSSGVRKCAGAEVEQQQQQQQDDNDRGRRTVRRRVRHLQRGSNSIVGISAGESLDVIVSDATCRMKDTVAGVRMIDDNNHDLDDPILLLNNRPREVVPGMDGFVIMEGRNLPPGKDDNAFVSTPRIGVGGGSSIMGEGAFNYVSTESLPVSHNSHTDFNPLHASNVFVNLENSGDRRTLLQDYNTGSDGKQQQQNCLVVQGNMIITTASNNNKSYSNYENLEGRIIDSLARDVNAMKLGLPPNDIIVRLRMQSPYGFAGPSTSSSSSVVAANMESSNKTTLNPLTTTFWQQEHADIPYAMSIIVCMTVLSLALLALFVKTSRRNISSSSSKSKSKIDSGKTITHWGVELDANRVLKDLHKANSNKSPENILLRHQAQEVVKEATSKAVAVATDVGVAATKMTERIGQSLSPKRGTCNEKEVELDANRVLKDLHKSNKKTEDDEFKTKDNSKVVATTAAGVAVTTSVIGRLVSMTKKDTPPKTRRAMSPDDSHSEGASISITIDSPKRTSMSVLGRRERSLIQDRSVHILDDLRWA